MEKTIFKKIIDKEISANIVYEDEQFIAFLDIAPVSLGHTLLIPKKEYVWIYEVPDEILGEIFIKAKQLIIGIKQALGCDFVQVNIVGKDVPHFHIHLIPRYYNEEIHHERPLKKYKEGEIQEYAQKISQNINTYKSI